VEGKGELRSQEVVHVAAALVDEKSKKLCCASHWSPLPMQKAVEDSGGHRWVAQVTRYITSVADAYQDLLDIYTCEAISKDIGSPTRKDKETEQARRCPYPSVHESASDSDR
jgi:hypothetical protein